MYAIKYCWMGILCLFLNLAAQAQQLEREVSLHLKGASVQQALQQLQKQYALEFSYLNNDLPAEKNLNLSIKNKPLREVLDRVLVHTSLGYAERNGRIIISKGVPKKVAVPNSDVQPSGANQHPGRGGSEGRLEATEVGQEAFKEEVKQEGSEPSLDKRREEIKNESSREPVLKEPLSARPLPEPEPARLEPLAHEVKEPKPITLLPIQLLGIVADKAVFDRIEHKSVEEVKPYHVGVVYPISNQGVESRRYANKVSLHLLVGYSGGLRGAEVAGFGNIVGGDVVGAQFAGWFNVVKGGVRGIQGSNFVNMAADSVRGAQFSGFANYSRSYLNGMQAGGFGNIARYFSGGQFGGFGNIADQVYGGQAAGFGNIATGVKGVQLAGFGNITDSLYRGAQAAGFGNVAGNVQGAQLSGFGNVAGRIRGIQVAGLGNVVSEVEGMQIAGLFNVAERVKGVQLGLLNIADTMEGVPIGLISIVRRGYRSLEVWTAEDFQANAAFKIGVERFYNIFAFGYEVEKPNRWGVGYGFGSLWKLGPRFRLNTDATGMFVVEDDIELEDAVRDTNLNLLNKFRLLGGWQFARHFSLFAGPTYNVMLSRHQNADGTMGSGIAPDGFYNKTSKGGTNLRMWVGFNAGLRF